MHISFLTPEYPYPKTKQSAGLGFSIKSLATALAAKGHPVSVVVYGQEVDEVILDNGITLHLIKHKSYPVLSWYLYRKHLQRYINKQIKQEGIDILEAPDWTGITAFMRLKCLLVLRLHGSDTYFCHLEGRRQKTKNRFFEKLALKEAGKVISVSQFAAQTTKTLFNLKKNIKVIHNGLNLELFKSDNDKSEKQRVLYFGTLIRKKGVLEIPHIIEKVHQKLPNCQFVFAGKDVIDFKTKESTKALMIKDMSITLQNQCLWLGALSYEAIKGELEKATVVILPSYAEALPMTWLEAMAMEKGLVTSNIGWANEVMIDGETGYMVNPKDHDTYANCMLKLLNSKQLRNQMGKAARVRVETVFDSRTIAQQNIAYYNSILNT